MNCYFCKSSFNRVSNYKRHLLAKHSEEKKELEIILEDLKSNRPFSCHECAKTFADYDHLLKHQKDCLTEVEKILFQIDKLSLDDLKILTEKLNKRVANLSIEGNNNAGIYDGDHNLVNTNTNTNSNNHSHSHNVNSNNVNNNQNVVVLNIGNENLEMLNHDFLQKIFNFRYQFKTAYVFILIKIKNLWHFSFGNN